jgi:hypothetical protein
VSDFGLFLEMHFEEFIFTVLLLILWEMGWKGIALWHAARNKSKNWFLALLITNTIGILPILYIYIIRKKTNSDAI